jgi:endonuclease-3
MTSPPAAVPDPSETLRILRERYPDAECALHHADAWQLLCATILSAQCTDARVNMVTPHLFARFPTPEALASADPAEVEEIIKSTGFFRQKARSLIQMSQDVVDLHGGVVPSDMEALTKLRGVGRKTANVIIGVAFGGNGVVVDTHVRRIARRLGWTDNTDPDKIEQDLMALFPPAEWTPLGHTLIHHGRTLCMARAPLCMECPVRERCPEGRERVGGSPAASPSRRNRKGD